MLKLRKNKKGFTLIELVVVIAILAILAMIAVPRLIGFQQRAKEQADNQTAAQVKNTIALMWADGEIVVPDTSGDGTVDGDDSISFTIQNDGSGVIGLTYDASSLNDRAGVAIDEGDLLTKIQTLITDIKLVSDRPIKVKVDGAGAVSSILS